MLLIEGEQSLSAYSLQDAVLVVYRTLTHLILPTSLRGVSLILEMKKQIQRNNLVKLHCM